MKWNTYHWGIEMIAEDPIEEEALEQLSNSLPDCADECDEHGEFTADYADGYRRLKFYK
jgi:hypothetical protein